MPSNNEIKAALDLISSTLNSLGTEVGFLKAERWALGEAMKDKTPFLYEAIEHFRSQDTYHNTRSGYTLMTSTVQEAVNKIRL
jgi:hypothetical protein